MSILNEYNVPYEFKKKIVFWPLEDRLLIKWFFIMVSSVGIFFSNSPFVLSKKYKVLFWLEAISLPFKILRLDLKGIL